MLLLTDRHANCRWGAELDTSTHHGRVVENNPGGRGPHRKALYSAGGLPYGLTRYTVLPRDRRRSVNWSTTGFFPWFPTTALQTRRGGGD